jgi:hypothetical protein
VLRLTNLASLAVVAAALTATSHAGVITVPSGLSPGSQFRLIFVTADTTDASSADIATYNSFVSNEANMNALLAGISWSAIGTTETVNAINNIGAETGIPVYNLAGNLVVSTTVLLFNGPSTAYSNPINIDQFGNTLETNVWTGTWDGGTIQPGTITALGDVPPKVGLSSSTDYNAYDAGSSFNTVNWGMYGISAVLTVPAASAVPEPGSMGLIGLGSIVVVAARRKFRAR